jgi:carotenoid cleavage dioxygenase
MTLHFPDTPAFTGFNRPARIEAEILDLEVEGKIPSDLDGTFYRVGPDFHYPPRLGDDININGDGMVSMFRVAGGHVDFKSRYVRTEKFLLESAARRALFGAYHNPFTDDASVAGKDRTTANTSTVFHGGKLFALKEDGLPHELDPDTLETRGRYDYRGKMTSVTTSSHPKIDPVSGEMITFGYEARGLATRDVALQIVDRSGVLVREEFFLAPYVSMQHDFAVTSRHIIFIVVPITADEARMKAGGPHWVFEHERETLIGIMPRDASTKDIRWFRSPSLGLGHVANAFSDGDKVYLDVSTCAQNIYPFIGNSDGTPFDRATGVPRLMRFTFDLGGNSDGFEAETLFDDFMDMPEIDDRYQLNAYSRGFFAIADGGKAALNNVGTLGVGWNTIAHVDLARRRMERFFIGPDAACQEPQFVPRRADAEEGDGYLLSVVTRLDREPHTELAVFDTRHIPDGPVAVARLPFRMRAAIHGCWVPGPGA